MLTVYDGMDSLNTDYTAKPLTEEQKELKELHKFKPM